MKFVYIVIVIGVLVLTVMVGGCTRQGTVMRASEDVLLTGSSQDHHQESEGALSQDLGTEDLTTTELKLLYQQYRNADDILGEIGIIRHMYDRKPTIFLQKLLIQKYLQIYRYNDALDLSKKLLSQNPEDPEVVDQYLFILFNSRQVNSSNISKLTHLLDQLYTSKSISSEQFHMYNALIHITKLDIVSFEQSIHNLSSTGTYAEIQGQIIEMLTLYRSYKDSPTYYLTALLSKVFFQHSYLKIADLLAQHSIQKKSDYILPLQVLSYTTLLEQKYDEADRSLNKLLTLDPDHAKLYRILLAIVYFEQKKYSNAIVYLAQIQDGPYYHLALRYLVLSYHYLDQDTKLLDTLQQLLGSQTLNEYDYYYVFDKIVYGTHDRIYQLNPILIAQYVDQCSQTLGSSHPVCIYGQAGMYHLQGKLHQAHVLLLKLTKYFHDAKIFALIAQYYESESNTAKAKLYYLKAIAQSDSPHQKQQIEELINALDL